MSCWRDRGGGQGTHTHTQTQTDTDTDTHRHTQTHTHTYTDIQTYTHTHTSGRDGQLDGFCMVKLDDEVFVKRPFRAARDCDVCVLRSTGRN